MDRKSVLAIVICFLIFMGWQKFYIEPRMPRQSTADQGVSAPQGSTGGAPTSSALTPPTAAGSTPPAPHRPSETRTLQTSTGEATLSDGNRAFKGWNLKGYHLSLAPETAAINLQSVTNQDGEVAFSFPDSPELAYLASVQGTFVPTNSGIAWTYEDQNVRLRREIAQVDGEPFLSMTVSAEFKNHKPNYFFLSLEAASLDKDPEAKDRQLLYWTDKSLDRVGVSGDAKAKDIITPVRYIAASNRYFILTLVNQSPIEAKAQVQPLATGLARLSLIYPVAGNSITVPVRVYFGPKELELLRRVDPALDNAVDLGFFQLFAYPLLKLLKFFYSYLGNYGLAIILLTLLIKLVTYPLNYKSMKSMREMAKLQPQLQKIREKYKDDKEALNREMLSLMKTHGYNPAAGCLPMLLQMPIFFALYRVLYSSIELFHAPFAFWIQDLSSRDPYYVTPVLLAALMFVQQKVTPQQTGGDPNQQKMMQFMPLLFGFMMLNLPSGLTLYMLINSIATTAQQLFLNKKLDARLSPSAAT